LTLSGGQKARVALARALYVDADVFLLDDVLAAVDRHVQRHLLQSIILPPHGLLRRTAPSTPDGASGFGVKTVVVVTNQLDWIPSADFVIALGGGGLGEDEDEACRVLAWGRPRELLEAGVDVAEIVREDARKAAGATPEDSAPEEESPINTIAEDLKSVGRGKVTSKGNDSKKTTTNDGFEIGSATAEKVNQAADSKTAQAEKDMRTGDEMRLKGAVKKEIWVGYARALGAWWSVLLILLYTVAQLSRTGGDLVIANWSMASSDADSGATSYLTLYAISTGLAAAVVFLRAVALVVASLRAAARAHDRALWATLRSPMAFFDTTTSGRVLNRFSSDMQLVSTNRFTCACTHSPKDVFLTCI
jgi:ATP-binding cassette subfamily C (CFTR/MRP) protein 1